MPELGCSWCQKNLAAGGAGGGSIAGTTGWHISIERIPSRSRFSQESAVVVGSVLPNSRTSPVTGVLPR